MLNYFIYSVTNLKINIKVPNLKKYFININPNNKHCKLLHKYLGKLKNNFEDWIKFKVFLVYITDPNDSRGPLMPTSETPTQCVYS